MAAVAIVTDADTCVPEALRRGLEILTAPVDAPLLIEPEPADVLRRDQAPAAADAAVVAAALARQQQEASLVSVPIAGTLMGAGWAAVAAAAASRAGRETGEVIAEAQQVGDATRVLALIEYPPLAGIGGGLAGALRRGRALVELCGAEIEVLGRPRGREAGLIALRERFADAVRSSAGYLRVAIHHAGAAPAAGAMQRWVERELQPEESQLAPLTRHAATRLGPGLVGFAWYREPSE